MPRDNHVLPSPARRAGDLLGGSVFSPSEQNITLLCALRASVVKLCSVYPVNPVILSKDLFFLVLI
jgi:hypothetical protein